MYSVILMMAVSTAPETQAFHNWGHGCYSSCGGCYSSCGGCWSSFGGWGHGHRYSSCYGSSYGGCYSSCYGSSYSSCSGYGIYGCGGYGGYGGCYSSGSGCAGNVTSYSCQGYGIYGGTTYDMPAQYHYSSSPTENYSQSYPSVVETPRMEMKEEKKLMYSRSNDKAQVVVRLPADAKLYANDQLTELTSKERVFSSPKLDAGKDYEYNLKVEYTRAGKVVTDTQVVRVKAGGYSVAEFKDKAPVTEVVSKIKIVAPEGARFSVESRNLPEGLNEFTTPQIAKGVEYSYSFTAEVIKNGKSRTSTQRVVFKGGEAVTVDFTDMDSVRTASK